MSFSARVNSNLNVLIPQPLGQIPSGPASLLDPQAFNHAKW